MHPLIVLLILDFSVFNNPLLVDAHTSHHHEVTELLHSFALQFLLFLVLVVILGFAFSFLISKQDIRESFTKISKRMVGLIELLAYELAGVFNSTLKCIFLAVGHETSCSPIFISHLIQFFRLPLVEFDNNIFGRIGCLGLGDTGS